MPCIEPHWMSSSIVIPGRYSLLLRSLMRLAYTLTASLRLSRTKLQANSTTEHGLSAQCIQLIQRLSCVACSPVQSCSSQAGEKRTEQCKSWRCKRRAEKGRMQ